MKLRISVIILIMYCSRSGDSASDNLTETMKRNSPAYAIMSSLDVLDNISQCKSDLIMLREGIDNRIWWSLKVLDASGDPKPGFVFGNNFWLGVKRQCLEIGSHRPFKMYPAYSKNNSLYRNVNEEFSPFEFNYFVAHFRHDSTLQYQFKTPLQNLITLGLCLPTSCTENEVTTLLQVTFQQKILAIQDLYNLDFYNLRVSDLKTDYQFLFSARKLIIGLVFIMILLMVVIGTAYDIFIYQNYAKTSDQTDEKKDDNGNQVPELRPGNLSLFEDIILSFSAYTNSKLILDTSTPPNSLTSLNGIRAIGMMSIMFVHSGLFADNYTDNIYMILRLSDNFMDYIFNNGIYSVDTFLFLGGFLTGWSHFKNLDKSGKPQVTSTKLFNWPVFVSRIMKRIIRITPPYMLTLFLIELYYSWIAEISIFIIVEKPHENCAKYWWRNLLYLGNSIDHSSKCLSWSWYLNNDMYFFIVTQFLLILSDKFFYTAAMMLITLLISSVSYSIYSFYIHNYISTMDKLWTEYETIYYPPSLRIGPYLVGIIAAYIMRRMNSNGVTLNKTAEWILWIMSFTIIGGILYRVCDHNMSFISTAIFMGLSRSVWGIGIACIIVACYTNKTGVINSILSCGLWVPICKVTFSAYLINPVIISSLSHLSEYPVHMDTFAFINGYAGVVILSYITAFFITIIVEVPVILLYVVFTKHQKPSKRKD